VGGQNSWLIRFCLSKIVLIMNQKWQCRGVSKIFDFAFAPIFNLLSTMHGKCHAQDAHQFIFEPEELSEARISPKHHGAKQRSGRFLS
jgi:hypothetical protein